ncbi:hypothetical protein ACFFGH_25100 [Lysobacter korlensis]|uniref:Uncharacterized protein n=1 Tax=Lysobacter korlensis TaxID=553636 RepID=A0ABV6RVW3_9GAMM
MIPPAVEVTVIDADGDDRTGDFALRVGLEPVADGLSGSRLASIHVRSDSSAPVDAVVRVAVAIPSADPWWLIPGAFYGENRPIENSRVFPRFQIGANRPADWERLISEAWEFRSDRAATPAVFVWGAPGQGGIALAGAAETSLGLTGIGLAHDSLTGRARVHLSFPFREGPVGYYGDAEPRTAETASHRFAPGEEVSVEVRLFELGADRHSYAPVLRRLHAESAAAAPLRPWVDVPTAADLAAHGLLRWHYDPEPGVLLETVGFDREVSGQDGKRVDRQAMHVGWVSGAPWAYALLRHGIRIGSDEECAAARRVLDFLTAELSPSGTLWGVWYRGKGWTQSWTELKRGLHSRTLAEATLFLERALQLEDSPQWERAVRSSLDVVVGRQRQDGNLGSVHHAETGEVLSWSGASGLAWVAALAASRHRDERYLPAAVAAGEYYARFVESEFLHGAPEDVDLAPTSEDGYVALMSYLALFEATGEERWLDLARRSADWLLTFRYSYDVSWAPTTILGMYDFGTRGADQASPSNQHLHAYGLICTRELRSLSEALGDPHYAERADETLACFRQFIARFDGDFNAYRGMVSERFYQTECFQPKGMLLTLSHAWCVGVLLLACEDSLEA